jgi:hypothetical protein
MKLDTIISIIVNGGGRVSKVKSKLLLQYLTEQQITEIENIAIKLINEMKEKFEIDVQKLVNSI